MILGLLNQKGGVGKTTLALNIAGSLARRGGRVLVLDADTQGSALDWLAIREGDATFSVVGLPSPTIHKQMPEFTKDYDHVIIDAPGRVEAVARSIVICADLVLIPVQPSPYDIWAAADVVKLIDEAKMINENLKVAFAINRKIVNTAIGRDVADALGGYNHTVFQSAICQRVLFPESAAVGKAAFEVDPNSPAAVEIEQLTDEILRTCNG
jgi:chromosome partitioning protein